MSLVALNTHTYWHFVERKNSMKKKKKGKNASAAGSKDIFAHIFSLRHYLPDINV